MDWLDLFIGSDGTLGIFTRIRLKLLPSPAAFVSGILFFEKEEDSWALVESIRECSVKHINPCSIEYFDRRSLDRLRTNYKNIPFSAKAALFIENDIESQKDHDSTLAAWFEYLNCKKVLLDESWFAQSPKDMRKFQEFRHALPALLNEDNSRLGRTKIGTDMAVNDNYLIEMMEFYKQELESTTIDLVVFGHLADNHLHINLLPTQDQTEEAYEIYEKLVNRILKWKGTISAEHGVGKLKKKYFIQMVGEASISDLMAVKTTFDPLMILGRGNIFD